MNLIESESYLTSRGWTPSHGYWMDPVMRRIVSPEKAVGFQQERDNCKHPNLVTVSGKKVCQICGVVGTAELEEKGMVV